MRPKITCHMITSLDGRLHPHRWSDPPEGKMMDLVERHYDTIGAQLGAEGWIVGRKTMAEFVDERPDPERLDAPRARPDHIVDRGGRHLAIAIDPSGRLVFESGELAGEQVVVILSERVSDTVLDRHREAGVAYVFAGPEGADIETALGTIGERFGVRHLLLEGGGSTNGAFLAEGLIDAVSTLIAPAIDGLAGVPSIYDHTAEPGAHPAAGSRLRLSSCGTLEGGIIWLRHDVVRSFRHDGGAGPSEPSDSADAERAEEGA